MLYKCKAMWEAVKDLEFDGSEFISYLDEFVSHSIVDFMLTKTEDSKKEFESCARRHLVEKYWNNIKDLALPKPGSETRVLQSIDLMNDKGVNILREVLTRCQQYLHSEVLSLPYLATIHLVVCGDGLGRTIETDAFIDVTRIENFDPPEMIGLMGHELIHAGFNSIGRLRARRSKKRD